MKHKKCKFRDGGYLDSACNSLKETVQFHPTKRSKGVFSQTITNIKTGENKGVLISIHSGDFTGNGIAMNFCPFCGEPTRDLTKEKEDS